MIIEIISALIVVILAFLFATSSTFSMPMSVFSTLIVLFSLAFIAFVGLVLRERPADEREALHAYRAGRLSFLVGSVTLFVGIVYQAFMHEIDIWLIFTLCVMVLTKIILLVISRYNS